jgi:hypothetical protein
LLRLLRDISNQDKHHARVVTAMDPAHISQLGTIEFETEEGAAASVPPDVTIHKPSFETGGLLYEHRVNGRIAKISGRLGYVLQVQLALPDGRSEDLALLLRHIGQYTELVLTHVAGGHDEWAASRRQGHEPGEIS